MKWKQRLLLVLSGAAFLALCHFGGHRIKPGESGASVLGRNNKPVVAASANSNKWRERRKHFVPESETAEEPSTAFPFSERSLFVSNVSSAPSSGPSSWIRPCNMEACFDFSRCPERPFRHYVYPVDSNVILTDTYRKILEVLKSSPLYTDDPSKACLFVLSLDTLDRDPLSEERYLRNVKARLEQLGPKWNGGQNHVVFNLYSGTHPDYDERDIGFDIGKAILGRDSALLLLRQNTKFPNFFAIRKHKHNVKRRLRKFTAPNQSIRTVGQGEHLRGRVQGRLRRLAAAVSPQPPDEGRRERHGRLQHLPRQRPLLYRLQGETLRLRHRVGDAVSEGESCSTCLYSAARLLGPQFCQNKIDHLRGLTL